MSKTSQEMREEALSQLRLEVASIMTDIEDIFLDYDLKDYCLTLVGRIPDKPESFVIVSNDDESFTKHVENIHKSRGVGDVA